MSASHVVVVGAGLAGARTVAELRAQGFAGRVTLLGAEGVAPYDRPPLSKHLVDRVEPAWLTAELGIDVSALADDVRLASPATGLELGDDVVRVTVADGEVVADAAVLATGGRAVVPGALAGTRVLRTAADADALRAAVAPGTRWVIVGAGWIGAELAWTASRTGVAVAVVEAGPAPLAGALGDVGAATAPWYAAAGVELRTSAAVTAADATSVTLVTGETLRADVVVTAVGARAESAWLAGALLVEADGSVAVDQGFRPIGTASAASGAPAGGAEPGTGEVARVRVVGDLARRRSARHGWVPGGHWDAALHGPTTAVADLLAELAGAPRPEPADPAPYVFSEQFGHDLGLYGQPGVGDQVVWRGDPASEGWAALWFAPGTEELTAILAVDRPRDVSAARHLFTGAGLPRVDRARAADPAVPLRTAAR